MFQSFGEYDKAKEYNEKALAMRREIDRPGEAADYGKLVTLFRSLDEYDKAKEYHEKALAMRRETGDRPGEAVRYGNLGSVFQSLGEYSKNPRIRTCFFRVWQNRFLYFGVLTGILA